MDLTLYYLIKGGGLDMDKNQFLEMVKQIGTIEDEVERRTKLTELSDSVSGIFDSNVELSEKVKNY